MNKTAFMNDEFFSEIIDDKIEEDGSNEAAAVEAMDSTENIADAINRQIPVEPGDAEYVENHSVIDCTNRYRMDDGRYNFTIKLPGDVSLKDVIIEITSDYSGTRQSCTNLFYLTNGENAEFKIRLENAYDGFNYYELTTDRFADTGMGFNFRIKKIIELDYQSDRYRGDDASLAHALELAEKYKADCRRKRDVDDIKEDLDILVPLTRHLGDSAVHRFSREHSDFALELQPDAESEYHTAEKPVCTSF